MRDPMLELLSFISYLITLYTYIVIAERHHELADRFNVINPYNPVVRTLWDATQRGDRAASCGRSGASLSGCCRISAAIDISPIFLLLGLHLRAVASSSRTSPSSSV